MLNNGSDPRHRMDKFEAHIKTKTNHRCPMCGSEKFEFGYETLAIWQVNTKGDANLLEPDRGRILAFVECMDCNYKIFFNPQKMGLIVYKKPGNFSPGF